MAVTLTEDARDLLTFPVQIGPAKIRNRVFVAPHTTNFGQAGANLVTDRHLDYHRARARGGAGLIITEGIRVHPTSLRQLGLQAYSDDAVPGLTALTEAVHAEGAAIFAQILHTGRHSGDEHYGSWAPSPTPWATGAPVPHAMNAFDLETLVASYAATVERVIQAGFDGMEVHLGHGHLLHQFLSPVTNARGDGYGGDPASRLRLALEVLRTVHDVVAGRVALGVRLSADEFLPGGLGPEEMVDIIRRLLGEVPLDFLHVSHAAYIGTSSLSTQMADMSYGRAPFRHLPARFKQEFPELTVLAVCRLDTPETGAELLAAGEADLVGFARAHIAEPRLLRAYLDQDEPAPRTCIACNQGCNANLEAITPITCTVNPAVGRERQWDAAAAAPARPQDTVVVGGGPAGIEAATWLSRRGHRVRLVDAAPELGGQLREVVRVDGRDGFRILLDELLAELATTDVTVVLGRQVTATDLAAWDPDAVVLATGAHHDAPMPAYAGVRVLNPEDVLRDPTLAGSRAVVVDELGVWEASGVALHLAARGVDVDYVTPLAGFAPRVTVYSRLALGDQLAAAGVAVHPMSSIGVDDGLVTIIPTIGTDRIIRDGVKSIVQVRPRHARSALVEGLLASTWQGELHLVGDAFAPRTSQEAIYEGRAVAHIIGVDDPTIAAGLKVRAPYRYPRLALAVTR
ncbi:FAD-dependent oxidoreductase [Georgenia yuyongxinii]|uniref:FAD-dependent oxidoreductase n=1 Tax=Georgenia yuyongxinii TaxID=2589797 RepID=A0A5B8C512_9MICO|nr:FAD-dependent oxidoreductase [Georgenia yuyongxinii]QDC25673.1 FAD-dependent oxidoreductase [Georgenia yuyongxinii]